MTPKVKATELINLFRPYVDSEIAGEPGFCYSYHQQMNNARYCALILVNERLDSGIWIALDLANRQPDEYSLSDTEEFWKEVKKELEEVNFY